MTWTCWKCTVLWFRLAACQTPLRRASSPSSSSERREEYNKNWKPISLLNVYYKIPSKAISNWVTSALDRWSTQVWDVPGQLYMVLMWPMPCSSALGITQACSAGSQRWSESDGLQCTSPWQKGATAYPTSPSTWWLPSCVAASGYVQRQSMWALSVTNC